MLSGTDASNFRNWLIGGGAAVLIGGAFGVGTQVGSKGADQRVAEARAEFLRDLASKESDARQCIEKVASLQAVLQLSAKDRERLLETAAVSAPLRFTSNGAHLRDTVQADRFSSTCIKFSLEAENTGPTTIESNGAEVLLPVNFSGDPAGALVGTIPGTTGPVARHWLEFVRPIGLGQKFYEDFVFCKRHKDSRKPDRIVEEEIGEGERIPAVLKVYSRNFLPASASFTLVAHRASTP